MSNENIAKPEIMEQPKIETGEKVKTSVPEEQIPEEEPDLTPEEEEEFVGKLMDIMNRLETIEKRLTSLKFPPEIEKMVKTIQAQKHKTDIPKPIPAEQKSDKQIPVQELTPQQIQDSQIYDPAIKQFFEKKDDKNN